MALHYTAKESNIRNSVKRFFHQDVVDSIKFVYGTYGLIPSKMSESRWVAVTFGTYVGGTLSEYDISLHLFVKEDPNEEKIADFRDELMKSLIDYSAPDGMKRIPLVDENWNTPGDEALIFINDEVSGTVKDTETKFKTVSLTLKWGSKGS